MEALLDHLVRALVAHPDAVEVTRVRQPGGDRLDVRVAPADFARVVGRNGRTARALRAVVGASDPEGRLLVNLVDPEELQGERTDRPGGGWPQA